jgi:hypothetical protein
MDKKLLKDLYKQYKENIDSIIQNYGEKDGFIIDGIRWSEYYKTLINGVVEKIKSKTLTENDTLDFYKRFGFAPKLYWKSFVENGVENISNLFTFLLDDSIPADAKINKIVEDPESDKFIRGVGINFVSLFLTVHDHQKYVQWNATTDGALKILNMYPVRDRGEKKSSFYNKINAACQEISKVIGVDDLTVIDSLLFCINRGYLNIDTKVVQQLDESVKESEIVEEVEETVDVRKHVEMMYYLIVIGINKNYSVWVATNDKNEEYQGKKFSDLCLEVKIWYLRYFG